MTEVLERQRENDIEERTKTEHNSRTGENYRKMMMMDYAELRNEMEGSSVYAPIDSAKPIFEQDLTFDQVEIPEHLKESVAEKTETEEETELSRPTGTTLQFLDPDVKGTSVAQAAETAAVGDTQKKLAAQLTKVIVAFAVAFALVMVAIAINSAVINGLDLQLTNLQQTLADLTGQWNDLQLSIARETGWESVQQFIQANGMVFVG